MVRLTGMTALALILGTASGVAEETARELGPIMVTATRAERPVSSMPGSVVIIEREDIARQLQLSNDPADLLERLVPGFSASNQTISGAAETFRGRSIQVLVNGVSRNTPLRNASRLISLIDLNQVERIEIVNGASGIYGNGATGGIINFITLRGAGVSPQTSVSVGLRAFTGDIGDSLAPEVSVNTRGQVGDLDYFLSLSGEQVRDTFDGDGNRLPDDPLLGQGAFSNSDKYNLNGTLGYEFDGQRVEITAEAVRLDQEPEFYTNYGTSPVSVSSAAPYTGKSVEEKSHYVHARYLNRNTGFGAVDLLAFYSDTEKRFADALLSAVNPFVYFSGNALSPVSPDGQTTLTAEQFGMKLAIDSDLSDIISGLQVTWGVDISRDSTEQHFQDGVAVIAPMEQDSYAAFMQVDQKLTDWLQVRAGVRYERFELEVGDFSRPSYFAGFAVIPVTQVTGGDFSYSEAVFNLGVVAFVTDEMEIYGGFSQGFSIPDVGAFTRRAGTATFPVVPAIVDFSSLGIEAAVVDNYELGVRGDWMTMRANLSGFVSTSDLGTNFDATLNQLQQQKERIYGIEFTGEWDATDELTLGVLARWTEGKRDTTGDGDLNAYLPNNRIAPPLRLTGYGDMQITDALSVNAEAVYFGERDQNDGTVQVKIASAFLVNMGADFAIDANNKVSLGIRNVLDRTYQNPTASANRNFFVNGFGRMISLRFATQF
ncbi:MAG: TonB-dependent receptor [Rhodobiaceae bacterium]|nr:MAG: TonB-dependent receptor [Rhodobiaceae bacterium]